MVVYLFLILAQIMVAISVVGSKYLIASSISTLFLLVTRFSLATVVLLLLHHFCNSSTTIRSHLEKLNRKDWIIILAQALSAGVFFNFLMLLGLDYTDANVAGIIMSALPALIAVLSFLFLKERLSVKKGFSIGLATLGLLVISSNTFSASSIKYSLIGNVIIFLALLPEAGYYILSKLQPNKLPIFLMAALMNGINAILLLPIAFLHENWHMLHLSTLQWIILGLVSIASGLFYVFWYAGSQKTDGITASLSTALMPIATVIIAWLTLGETVGAIQLIGMGLVMASIVAYTFS